MFQHLASLEAFISGAIRIDINGSHLTGDHFETISLALTVANHKVPAARSDTKMVAVDSAPVVDRDKSELKSQTPTDTMEAVIIHNTARITRNFKRQ